MAEPRELLQVRHLKRIEDGNLAMMNRRREINNSSTERMHKNKLLHSI